MKSISFRPPLPPVLKQHFHTLRRQKDLCLVAARIPAAARPSPTNAAGCTGLGGVGTHKTAAPGARWEQEGHRLRGCGPCAGVSACRAPRTRTFLTAAGPAAAPGVGRATAAASPRPHTLGAAFPRGARDPLEAAESHPDLVQTPGRAVPNPAGFRGAGCGRYLPSAAAGRGAGG